MSARGRSGAGEVKTQTARVGVSEGIEGRQEIRLARYCRPVGCEETEKKTESFTGTACATFSRDESPVGCEASRRGKQCNLDDPKFSTSANAVAGKQGQRCLGSITVFIRSHGPGLPGSNELFRDADRPQARDYTLIGHPLP